MKNALISSLLLASSTMAATWDYKKNGADWVDVYAACGKENQSPIDLLTSWDVEEAKEDAFNKLYTNQKTAIPITWNGHTSQIAVNKTTQDLQTFHSNYAKEELGATDRFTGVQFHFHHGSEHTIDGKRHDLEMHTVHLASETLNDVGYAAMGIMFSVDDSNIELDDE